MSQGKGEQGSADLSDEPEDMRVDKGVAARKRDLQGESPPKLRRGDDEDQGLTVTVGLLRNLLAEQQRNILDAQREIIRDSVQNAMHNFEERQEGKVQAIQDKVDGFQGAMTDVRKQLGDLQAKVKDLETGAGSTAAPSSTEDESRRNRQTLVFGGFARDTRRNEIVEKVGAALKLAKVANKVDGSPFTTRPRSSFALLRFELRDGEHPDKLKSRLHEVMDAVIRQKVPIAGRDRPMWVGLSKTKHERIKAQHCGAVRAAIRYFDEFSFRHTDCHYQTGTTWVGQSRVACATDPAPNHDGARIHFPPDKGHQGWIDVTALSGELQCDPDELEKFLVEGTH